MHPHFKNDVSFKTVLMQHYFKVIDKLKSRHEIQRKFRSDFLYSIYMNYIVPDK